MIAAIAITENLSIECVHNAIHNALFCFFSIVLVQHIEFVIIF